MFSKAIAASVLAVLACGVSAAPAKQFKSVEEVGDFTQDFIVETGTLKVLKKKPLHIQLRTENQADTKLAAEAMFRAYLWGVYRTFLHTNTDEVTVTVVSPVVVDGSTKFTATSTRARALATVQQIPGITGWNDLLTASQSWSEPMKRCMYSSYGKPGMRECALSAAAKR